ASSNGTGTQNVSKSDDGGSGGGGKADANNDDAGGAATTTSSKSTNSKSDAAKASKTDDAASTGKDTTTAQNGDDASAADEEPEEYSADMSEISAPDEGLEQEDAPEIEDRDDTVDTVELAANASTKAGAPRKARPVKVVVKMPEMPNNAKITTTAKNGSKLPKWVKFDPATGVLGGTPPADFKGTINAVIQVPQLDGTIKSIPATLKIK
ncbi:MAG: putative Ig domain-containing protein, partial [Oceanococcus sp.]